jgi:predicted HTH transcriptional regulator
VTYELPRDAVAEAIVNAVAHRDYASNASVQVMLFSDRLEIWNPGELPPPLTIEKLQLPHASFPHNPLVADPLFLARYIEKAGSGILDMIRLCRDADLPDPEFRQDGGMFVQTIRRNTLTEETMDQLGLSDRQRTAVFRVLEKRRLTSADYQKLTGASRQTAARDLEELVAKGVLLRQGRGRGVNYLLAQKWLKIDPNGS